MNAPGLYHATVKTAVTTTAKGSGNMQVATTWNITHFWDINAQQWAALPTPIERQTFWSLTDNAYDYTRDKLVALGFQGDFNDIKYAEKAYMEGFDLECTHETYEGKTREKWEVVRGAREFEKAPDDQIRRLNARWSTAAPAKPSGRPAPPPASSLPTPGRSQINPGAAAAGATTSGQPRTRTAPPPAPPPQQAAPEAATAVAEDNGLKVLMAAVKDRNTAWAVWCEASSNAPDINKWNEAIASIGKHEGAFLVEDWQAVASKALPF